ncbi:MAG: hypothetical protein JWL90_1736 [Chthoniobacteraceae bacterium]|nr:hypothetical protein [Chthoniobacteraceae bacterium]MDB6175418.1 hypothetical protein [Chthoniobacteraceae bacterium]
MSNENPAKIEIGGEGRGLVDATMLEKRAAELAKIEGRHSFTDKDLAEARAELLGSEVIPPPPEAAGTEVENITSWDDLLGDSGGPVQTQTLEDEATLGESLVQEGLEEADHDIRLAASDELPPDDEPRD